MRRIVAVLISTCYAVFVTLSRPFRRFEDDMFAAAASLILLLIFVGANWTTLFLDVFVVLHSVVGLFLGLRALLLLLLLLLRCPLATGHLVGEADVESTSRRVRCRRAAGQNARERGLVPAVHHVRSRK